MTESYIIHNLIIKISVKDSEFGWVISDGLELRTEKRTVDRPNHSTERTFHSIYHSISDGPPSHCSTEDHRLSLTLANTPYKFIGQTNGVQSDCDRDSHAISEYRGTAGAVLD